MCKWILSKEMKVLEMCYEQKKNGNKRKYDKKIYKNDFGSYCCKINAKKVKKESEKMC